MPEEKCVQPVPYLTVMYASGGRQGGGGVGFLDGEKLLAAIVGDVVTVTQTKFRRIFPTLPPIVA